MDADSLLEFKKKLHAFRTGQSIPEYLLWPWKSLELTLLRGCQNILGNIIVHVPCTLPYAFAVGDGTQSKTKSFQWAPEQEHTNSLRLGLHLTTSLISVKKPPLHYSDVKRKMLLSAHTAVMSVPSGLCCISKRNFCTVVSASKTLPMQMNHYGL